MGAPEGQAILGFTPSGLLPDERTSVACELDQDRWSRVEERTADLIAHIQPNRSSEDRRNAIASYVQHLIMKCFPCEVPEVQLPKVFTFGSVPLKTYLPDGDIDLTAFSNDQNFKDSWVHDVRDILESEERSEDAEFHVKEVQYIQAEVRIIKCLVENIVVDISFNQLGGLCTLCFLEEVDNLISQNHLFKRSSILIKAWCYYESRILGAHHGLISTYALETLVLYIFHVYNNAFSGPLEVLYRFLEFFSKFDWDNYCLSLWGPVPIRSLPDTQAEPPRRDCTELLLSKYFLDACSSVYTATPSSQESQDQPFVSKYFNIIDPLRANNNLGRSVSKGNFFRIRSAFAFGAQRLVRLLDCPEENLIAEFDLFFRNTWDRYGKGHRPDAPSADIYARNKEVENATCHESEVEGPEASHASHGVYGQQINDSRVSKQMFGISDASSISNTQSHKINGILSDTMTTDLKHANSMKNALTNRSQSPKYTPNEVHAMHHFARRHSSPEFTHISGEVPPQPRHIGPSETERGKGHSSSSIIDNSKRSSLRSKVSDNYSERISAKDQQSSWQASFYMRSGDAVDSKDAPNKRDVHSVEKLMQMHQEEQDFINMTATYRNHSFNGCPQAPNSANSTNTPFPVPLPFLTSGYTHVNSVGMVPGNVPFEYFWGHNMPYSQGLGSLPGSQCFPNVRMPSSLEEINETIDENLVVPELDHEHGDGDGDGDGGFWSEQDVKSVRVHDHEDGNVHAQQQRDRKTFASVSSNSVNSSCQTSSGSYSSKDYGESFENGQLISRNYGDDLPDEGIVESNVNPASKSFISALHATSTTKVSFSSFSNGSTLEDPKLGGLKTAYPTESSSLHVKKYDGPVDRIILQRDDGGGDWIRQPTVGTDLAEGTSAGTASSVVQSHPSTSYGQRPMNVSSSTIPVTPVLVDHSSRHRSIDEQGLLPVIFYPTGPPVPFLTMLPLYNLPAAEGSYTATNHVDNDAELGNHNGQSSISLDSTENLKLSGTLNKPGYTRHDTTLESFGQQKFDILNGDFASHWQNLQYGRFCQNTESQGLLPYPPSVASPMFVQGQFPWDNSGRLPANTNSMTRALHFVPMMPIRRNSDGHVGINQHSPDEPPRFCGGTGPYLPNPKLSRNRHYPNTRNHRGSYFYDRKDHHGEREGDWTYNSKPRFATRNSFRYHVEKSGTRMDKTNLSNRRPGRPSSSYKPSSFNSSMSNSHITSNVPYAMHPLPVVSASGISPSESAVPSIVMLYPHDQNVNYGASNWPEFGSLGPVHFSRANKPSHRGESSHNPLASFEEDSTESSPDEP